MYNDVPFYYPDNIFAITWRTFKDVHLIFALATIGSAVKKICTDIRVLQAMGELLEPFEKAR